MKPSDLLRAVRYDGLFWRRMAHFGAAYGPSWWRRYSPNFFGAAFYVVLGSRRRAVRENHRRIRPERGGIATERATLSTFLAFARCLTDSMETTGLYPPDFEVEAIGESHLEAAHRAGHGAVMVTAHVGNWDLFGRVVAQKGYPISIAMAREKNETVRPFAEGLRDAPGVQFLYTDDTAFAALDLLRAIRSGRILAVQIDRPAGSGGDHEVALFGGRESFALGPFLLAQAAGAPVIPILSFLIGHHRYRIEISEPIEIPRGRGRRAAETALETVVARFEASVRAFPEQWFRFTAIRDVSEVAPPSE